MIQSIASQIIYENQGILLKCKSWFMNSGTGPSFWCSNKLTGETVLIQIRFRSKLLPCESFLYFWSLEWGLGWKATRTLETLSKALFTCHSHALHIVIFLCINLVIIFDCALALPILVPRLGIKRGPWQWGRGVPTPGQAGNSVSYFCSHRFGQTKVDWLKGSAEHRGRTCLLTAALFPLKGADINGEERWSARTPSTSVIAQGKCDS